MSFCYNYEELHYILQNISSFLFSLTEVNKIFEITKFILTKHLNTMILQALTNIKIRFVIFIQIHRIINKRLNLYFMSEEERLYKELLNINKKSIKKLKGILVVTTITYGIFLLYYPQPIFKLMVIIILSLQLLYIYKTENKFKIPFR